MTTTYTLELHEKSSTKLIQIKASSLENALYGAQWLHKNKLVTIPVDLYEEVC
jgi:hypothetical protein